MRLSFSRTTAILQREGRKEEGGKEGGGMGREMGGFAFKDNVQDFLPLQLNNSHLSP